MNVQTKRRCTYATILFYNLCNGIAYAIIFPTIWRYSHERYGASQSMFGFIIAGYSISSFIANPLVGFWGDKTHNTKSILLLAIVAEILGSIMYFFGISKWFLAFSRLISGLGGGATSVVIADITHTTTDEARTPVLALVVASRQLGLLIGPGLNLFLSKINFKMGPFLVDKFTSPGLFMTILWVIVNITVLLLYFNLTSLKDEEDIEHLFSGYRRENSLPQETFQSDFETSGDHLLTSSFPNYSSTLKHDASILNNQSSSVPNLQAEISRYFEEHPDVTNENIKTTICENGCIRPSNVRTLNNIPIVKIRTASECSTATDNMIESAERFIQSASESYRESGNVKMKQPYSDHGDVHHYSEGQLHESVTSLIEVNRSFVDSFNYSFFRDEIIVLLGLNFISAFAQTSLETIVTPLVQKFYGFDEMENSLIYFFAGIEAIIVFVGIRYISRKVSDRTIILWGVVALCIALMLPLLSMVNAKPGQMSSFPYFVIIVILDLFGMSVILVCASSLLSKIVSQDCQALAQGFRRSMISLGCIMGPLWGGAYLNHLTVLFAVPFAVSCLIGVLFLCSYKRMV